MKHLLTTLFAFCVLAGSAQKHDYTWLAGYSSQGGYDSVNFHYWFGISKFQFTSQTVSLSYDSLGFNAWGANAAISNFNGDLQFYTNGITVRNYQDEIIGDSIHDGYFLNNLSLWYYYGNPQTGVMVVLPHPTQVNKYDILYCLADTLPGMFITVKKALRTQVDMSLNFGKGGIVYKDQSFLDKELAFGLNAVKHANGKDWWIITKTKGTNCYNVMLYNGSDSIKAIANQCGGTVGGTDAEYVVMRFSPNGNNLLSISKAQADFFEFDRCNGHLTFIESVYLSENVDSSGYQTLATEFSPSSHYVYLCSSKELFQYNLLATPIASSKTSIAKYIPYNPSGAPLTYNFAQLAPDGKIYIASKNGTYYMAVINNPDQAGAACNFQDTVKLPSFILGLPYYPNYRLGALAGSPCDTVTAITTEKPQARENQMKVFPNPSVNEVVVDYGFTDWGKGNITLQITNALGQVVHTQTLPLYSGFQKLNISPYPAGTYLITLLRGTQTIATTPLLKE